MKSRTPSKTSACPCGTRSSHENEVTPESHFPAIATYEEVCKDLDDFEIALAESRTSFTSGACDDCNKTMCAECDFTNLRSSSTSFASPVASRVAVGNFGEEPSKDNCCRSNGTSISIGGVFEKIGSLIGFNKFDTCGFNDCEDEQIRHHRDVMNPGLKIRKDGYMLPTLYAKCASSCGCGTEAATPISDDDCPNEDDFKSSCAGKGDDESPPDETRLEEEEEESDCSPIRTMIRLCPQVKNFCPIPFENPDKTFADFKCKAEWNKNILPEPEEEECKDSCQECSQESKGAEDPCALETKEYDCFVAALEEEKALSQKSEEDSESDCTQCEQPLFSMPKLRPHEDFCPSPFSDPSKPFNDFVCDPNARLNTCDCNAQDTSSSCIDEGYDGQDVPYCDEMDDLPFSELNLNDDCMNLETFDDCGDGGDAMPFAEQCDDELDLPYCDEMGIAPCAQCEQDLTDCKQDLTDCKTEVMKLQRQLQCCRTKRREAEEKLEELMRCQPEPEPEQCEPEPDSCEEAGAGSPQNECEQDPGDNPDACNDGKCEKCGVSTDCMQQILSCHQKLCEFQTQFLKAQHEKEAEAWRKQQVICEERLKCYQKALKDVQTKLEELRDKEAKKAKDSKSCSGGGKKAASKNRNVVADTCINKCESIIRDQLEANCPQMTPPSPPAYMSPGMPGGGCSPGPPGYNPGYQFGGPPSSYGGGMYGPPSQGIPPMNPYGPPAFGPYGPPAFGPYGPPMPPGPGPYGFSPPMPMPGAAPPYPPGAASPFPPGAPGGQQCCPSPTAPSEKKASCNDEDPCKPKNQCNSHETKQKDPCKDKVAPKAKDPCQSKDPCKSKKEPCDECGNQEMLDKIRKQFDEARQKRLGGKTDKADEEKKDALKKGLQKCRQTLTEIKKRISICEGKDIQSQGGCGCRKVDKNEDPEQALKCCLGELQIEEHKLRCIMHDRIVGPRNSFNNRDSMKLESPAKCNSCGKSTDKCTCGSEKSQESSCGKCGQKKPFECVPVVYKGGCQGQSTGIQEDCCPPINFPGQTQSPYQPPMSAQPQMIPPQAPPFYGGGGGQFPNTPYGGSWPSQGQFSGFPAPGYSPQQYYPQQPYGYPQPPIPEQFGLPPTSSKLCGPSVPDDTPRMINPGDCDAVGLNDLEEVKCPPGCVPAAQKEAALSKCDGSANYDCEEGEANIKKSFAKWDVIPPTRLPVIVDEDMCDKFDTKKTDCPDFDQAAKLKCPDFAIKIKTKEEKLKLLQNGKPQCDFSCFKEKEAEETKKSEDWIHQNTCDCPTCSISRLLQSDDDTKDDDDEDECCDPCRCRECGALLDEDGNPIEDDDEEEAEGFDPCDPNKDRCYSKKFDLDEKGKPIMEGGMCMDRAQNFLWKASEENYCDSSLLAYRRTTDFNGFPTPEAEKQPYVGGTDICGTERYMWNRPPPEEPVPETKVCPKKKKKCTGK